MILLKLFVLCVGVTIIVIVFVIVSTIFNIYIYIPYRVYVYISLPSELIKYDDNLQSNIDRAQRGI